REPPAAGSDGPAAGAGAAGACGALAEKHDRRCARLSRGAGPSRRAALRHAGRDGGGGARRCLDRAHARRPGDRRDAPGAHGRSGGRHAGRRPPGGRAVRIGFVPFEWVDLLDIIIVAFLVYQLYRLIRGTIAVQISIGLLAVYIVDVIVRAAGLTTLRALFGAISDVF